MIIGLLWWFLAWSLTTHDHEHLITMICDSFRGCYCDHCNDHQWSLAIIDLLSWSYHDPRRYLVILTMILQWSLMTTCDHSILDVIIHSDLIMIPSPMIAIMIMITDDPYYDPIMITMITHDPWCDPLLLTWSWSLMIPDVIPWWSLWSHMIIDVILDDHQWFLRVLIVITYT